MQVSKCCDQCALFAALFRVFFSCVLFGVFCGFGFGVFSCVVSCVLMDFRLPSKTVRSDLQQPASSTQQPHDVIVGGAHDLSPRSSDPCRAPHPLSEAHAPALAATAAREPSDRSTRSDGPPI